MLYGPGTQRYLLFSAIESWTPAMLPFSNIFGTERNFTAAAIRFSTNMSRQAADATCY
jgi:hypothetical protein